MPDRTATTSATPGAACQVVPLQHPETRRLIPDPLRDIIPACGISLLAGAPNVGKTALLASLACHFRDQRPVFGHAPAAVAAIGVINADRGWERGAGVWFARAGFPDVRYYSMIDDPSFDPRSLRKKFDRTERFKEFVDRLALPKGSLLIADPISLFLGGNLLDYDTCAVACLEIRKALQLRSLTLIAAAHSSKLKADRKERYVRLQDQILGSTALFGFTDTQMVLAAPEETGKPYYTFVWHSHLVKPEFFYLERDEQGLFVPYSGADEGNCTRVLALLPDDGSEVAFAILQELAAAIPLSRRTLVRVLEVLVERERIEKVRHGVYKRKLLH